MAQVDPSNILILIQRLSERTGEPKDLAGFGAMSEQINEKGIVTVSKRYLYEKLYRKAQKASEDGTEEIRLRDAKLDQICQFLGYKNLNDFIGAIENTVHDLLQGCIGTWLCYVRRNSKSGVLFESPARIFEKEHKIWLELIGPEWVYIGELRLQDGCLFCLLSCDGGKEFHHVYRIGKRNQPRVLQGIFSGVSTGFSPIGGRVVLIRVDDNFESLRNKQWGIDELKISELPAHAKLAAYFSNYHDNNLKNNEPISFDLDDLDGI